MAVKKRVWNPSRHPRDSRGRFIRSAAKVMTPADRRKAAAAVADFNPSKIGDEAGARAWLDQNAGAALPEGSALAEYFAGGWKKTNPAMRQNKAGAAAPPEVAEIDAQLAPIGADVMLRRRVPLTMFAKIPMPELEGMKLRDVAYASTSLDRPGLTTADGDVTIHIAAPASTRGYVNAADGEILLAHDTEMAISRVVPNGAGGWDIYAAVIPAGPAPRGRRRDDDQGADDETTGDQTEPAPADAPAGTDQDAPAPAAAPEVPAAGDDQDAPAPSSDTTPADQPAGTPAEPAAPADPFDDPDDDEASALAAMTPADRMRVQIAVEDHGPTYFASPLIGGNRDDVVRYVADSNLDDIQATYGRRATWDAVAAVVKGNPDLLTRTEDERQAVRDERRAEAQRLSSQAAAAMRDGDFDGALSLIDDGEATDPDFRTGTGLRIGRSWPELRAIVARRRDEAQQQDDDGDQAEAPAPAAPDAPASPSGASNEEENGETEEEPAAAAPERAGEWESATTGEPAWYLAPGPAQVLTAMQGAARRSGNPNDPNRIRPRDRRRMEQSIMVYGRAPGGDDPAGLGLSYVDINGAARNPDGSIAPDASPEVRQVIEDMDRVIGASVLRQPLITERGIQNPEATIPGWPGDGDATGLEWSAPGFQSTSTRPDVAERFARAELIDGAGEVTQPTVLRMLVPEGTGALQMSHTVQEVLLGRGHGMRVVADNGVDEQGVRRLDVEVLPPGTITSAAPETDDTSAQHQAAAAEPEVGPRFAPDDPAEPGSLPDGAETLADWLTTQGYTEGEPDRETALTGLVTSRLPGYRDERSGITVSDPEIFFGSGAVTAVWYLTDSDGNAIGTAQRGFYRSNDYGNTRPYVDHSELSLTPGAQGAGFAARFNARSEEFYRAQGFQDIQLTANVDVGGYAWARQGYDFAHTLTAAGVGRDLLGALGDIPRGPGRYGADWPADVQEQARELARRAIDADEKLVPELVAGGMSRADAIKAAVAAAPTPLEFAMLGWTPDSGDGRAAMWPGKQFMLSTTWRGNKDLDGNGRPELPATRDAGTRLPSAGPERIDSAEATRLAATITGDDDRAGSMRQALLDGEEIGDPATVYVSRDGDRITGAMSVVDYTGEDEGTAPYSKVENVGASADAPGTGTAMVRQAIEHALAGDAQAIYVEPTAAAEGFWQRMGFTTDPLDLGTSNGLDRAGMQRWLDGDRTGTNVPTGGDAPAQQLDLAGGVTDFVPASRASIGVAARPDVGRERAMAAVQQLGLFGREDAAGAEQDGLFGLGDQLGVAERLLDMPRADPPPSAPAAPLEAPAPARPASIVPDADELAGWNDEQLGDLFARVSDVPADELDEDGLRRIADEWDRRDREMTEFLASIPEDLTTLDDDAAMQLYADATSRVGSASDPILARIGADLDRRDAEQAAERENAPKRAMLARPVDELSDDELAEAIGYAGDLGDENALQRLVDEIGVRDERDEAARVLAQQEADEQALRERQAAAAAADAETAARAQETVDRETAEAEVETDFLQRLFDEMTSPARQDEAAALDAADAADEMALADYRRRSEEQNADLAASYAGMSDQDLNTEVYTWAFAAPGAGKERATRARAEQQRRKALQLAEQKTVQDRRERRRLIGELPENLTDKELADFPALLASMPGDAAERLAAERLPVIAGEVERRALERDRIAAAKAAGPAAPARYLNPVDRLREVEMWANYQGRGAKGADAERRLREAKRLVLGLPEAPAQSGMADFRELDKAIAAAERKDPRPLPDRAALVLAWYRHLGEYDASLDGVREDEYVLRGHPDDPDVPDTPDPLPPANIVKADEVWDKIQATASEDLRAGDPAAGLRFVRAVATAYRIPWTRDFEGEPRDEIRRIAGRNGDALRGDGRTTKARAALFVAEFRRLAAEDGVDPNDTARYGPPDRGAKPRNFRTTQASTPEQDRRIDNLMSQGWDFIDAFAEVHGLDADALRREQGAEAITSGRGGRESDGAAMRAAYMEHAEQQYLAAEQETRGYLVNRKGQAEGIDPKSLFSGDRKRAMRYASEELLRFWASNPRLGYADFKAQVGTSTRAARERQAAGAEGNEFA